MGSFETSEKHSSSALQPLHVAVRRESVYQEARELVDDLDAWKLLRADDEALSLECERRAGFMGATSLVTITVAGEQGIPSSTVHVKSVSTGGLISRDKQNVAEFMTPFRRRIG